MCVHIVWSVQALTPTMTKCVCGGGGEGGGGGCEGGGGMEITDRYCGG